MRRATMSAPGSPWIRASSAEASSDLIDGIRYRLAVNSRILRSSRATSSRRSARNSSTVGIASPSSSRATRCARLTAASPVIRVTTPSSSTRTTSWSPLASPSRLLPNCRGQSYSAVLREPDPQPDSCTDLLLVATQAIMPEDGVLSGVCPLARRPAAGPVAQRLELAAHNGLVVGSNPAGPTPADGGGAIDERARPAKRPLRKPDEQRLFNRAVFYLGRFAASERHLAEVLRRKALREAAAHDIPASRSRP